MYSQLDRTDHQLIALLQNNARLTNKELAGRVGLAPSSCLARVGKLVDAGVITGFHAEVDPESVGVGVQALINVQLGIHNRSNVELFWREILGLPEVVRVFHVTGEYDFIVHVAVKSTDHLRDLALSSFTERPEVVQIKTSLIYDYGSSVDYPVYAGDSSE